MTNAELLAAIKADKSFMELANSGRDNELADAISAAATETAPKPFTAADIYGVLQPASVGKLLNWVNLSLALADINKLDRAAIGFWGIALSAAGILTADDVKAINGVLTATIKQPVAVDHVQVSEALNQLRPEGKALPIDWNSVT